MPTETPLAEEFNAGVEPRASIDSLRRFINARAGIDIEGPINLACGRAIGIIKDLDATVSALSLSHSRLVDFVREVAGRHSSPLVEKARTVLKELNL